LLVSFNLYRYHTISLLLLQVQRIPSEVRIISILADMDHPWLAVAMIMQVQMMVVTTAVTTIATVEAIPVMRTSPHQITIIMIMPGVIIVVTIPVVITMEHLH